MARLGRPKSPKVVNATFRLTQKEYSNLRKCAIGENTTMTELVRQMIKRHMRRLQEAGNWPDSDEREGGEDGDT